MTVVGLHPEELFDKLIDGEISAPERDRLRAHLDACEVCRFEYAARFDFQEEALALRSLSAPPSLPLRAPQPVVEAAPRPRRRRSRLLVWGISAAAVITASGAVASVLAGKRPWSAVSVMFAPSKTPPADETPSKKMRAATSCTGADCSPKPAPVASHVAEVASVSVFPVARTEERVPRAFARRSAAPAPKAREEAPIAASPPVTQKDPSAKELSSAAKLFGDANQARRSGDIGRATGLYNLLQDQYPGSPEAELSRVTLALLMLDSGDAQAALKGFERYLAGGARGLEAEALVGRARALGRLGRRDLELAAWREVQRKFPRSIYGRQATERLAALGQP